MTDIQAIKKAAEAAIEADQALTDSGACDLGRLTVNAMNATREMKDELDPATVLELCRLAEIGQNTEAKCVWSEDDDGIWTAKCGYTFVSYEGTPLENEMKFCPSCGSRLFQVRFSARISQ
jgi:rRNA maturation endonuclease Nob1